MDESKIFPDISKAISQGEKMLGIYQQTHDQIVANAKALKEMVSANPLGTAKDFAAIAQALKDAKKATDDYNKSQKESKAISKALIDARIAEEKLAQQKIKTAEMTRKAAERQAEAERKLNSEYSKQSKQLTDLRNKYKDLILVQGKETAETRALLAQITKLDQKLKSVDATVGQSGRHVGNYTESINKAKVGLNNLASALGVATGIYLFTNAIKGAFNIIRENEDAFASLSAITGLTGEKFEVFKTAINDVATELKVSSTDVAAAAEKIASAQPKLLENADALAAVTKQAITLNKAIKGDLTETSMALVGVMNQFGYEANQASRVINVLAAGSKAGAATVNQLNEAMTKSGAVAKLQGLEVEQLTGAIETLGEKAIFGADAGTALRNILLKMGGIDALPKKALAELEKYGVDTKIVGDTTLDFSERLKELSKIAGDSTAIMKVFGIENATAATVLLNNIDTYDKMTAAVTGTNVAEEQAAINSNTLTNVIAELGAAWENLVNEWANGTDVAGGLKDTIRFITENLKEIIETIFAGLRAWAAYRLALVLWNKEGTGVINVLKNMLFPLKQTGDAIAKTGESVKKVNIGFAGWMAILAALLPYLIQAGKELYEFVNRTTSLEKATERLTEEMGKEKDEMALLFEQIKLTNAGSKERGELIDKINDKYGTSLQNLEDENLFMRQLGESYKAVIAQMEKKLYAQILEEEMLDALKRKREAEKDLAAQGFSWLDILNPTNEAVGQGFMQKSLNDALEDIEMLRKEMALLGVEMSGSGEGGGLIGKLGLTSDAADDIDGVNKGLGDTSKKVQDINNEVEKLNLTFSDESFLDQFSRVDGTHIVDIDAADMAPISDGDFAIQPEDIIKKATAAEIKEAYDSITDSVQRLSDALSQLIQLRVNAIETEQAQSKDEIQRHEERISQMKQLAAEGLLTAEQSIKAEEMQVSKLEARVAELEAKKQKLLLINLALQTALNLAEGGDGSAIAKATGQIGEMVGKINSFKEGTDQTGRGNVDSDGGFHAVLHPDEMVMQKDLSDPLRKRGMDRFDVATYAMRYHDEILNNNAMANGSFMGIMELATLNGLGDKLDDVVSKLDGLPKRMPVYKQDYDAQRRAFVDIVKVDNEIRRHFTFIKK